MPGVVAAAPPRRQLLLAAATAVLIFFRTRLIRFLRAAFSYFPEQWRRASLIERLPGPAFSEGEHTFLGHCARPPFFKDGEKFDLNVLMERLMGVIIDFARADGAQRVHRVVGGNSKLYKLGVPMPVLVFALEEQVFRTVLASRNQRLFKKGDKYVVSKPLIGNGVLASAHAEWAHQRPILELGFKRSVLDSALPKVLQTADELCERVARGAAASGDGAWEFQVPELMLKLTMDVIGRAAFDHDFHSVTAETSDDAPLYGPFKTVLKGLSTRGLSPVLQAARNVPIKFNRNIDAAIGRINHFARMIIDKRIEEHERSATTPDADKPKDLVDAMVLGLERHRSGDVKRGFLTEENIVDNIQTSLFAGHDTTAAALTWMTHLLATHPEWQQRLRDEVVAKCGAGAPTAEDIEGMLLLNAATAETLRLYPSAGFTRQTLVDVDFGGGLVVPEDTEITLFPIVLHRNPKYFTDPDEFRPERWVAMLSETETDGAPISLQARLARYSLTHAYFPFSHGERNCVGKPLALLEIRAVMLRMLQRFRLDPVEDADFRALPVMDLTLNPKSVKVRATPLPDA